MKRLLLLSGLLAIALSTWAQGHSLTFTSVTDAKFFVYLNGKLQNEKSSGMVTLQGLEEKKYHIRIVIDDPFEVAVTSTIKPDGKHNEYTVHFNAVRERVYLKPAKEQRDTPVWQDGDDSESTVVTQEPVDEPKRQQTTLRQKNYEDTATQRVVNRVKTHTIYE